MTRLTSEPSMPILSLEELMATAIKMEKESADRYADLAVRMRDAGREDLGKVFDRLVKEENNHMEMVVEWSEQTVHHPSNHLLTTEVPDHVFDDEGAALISPKLLDAYRSFAIAVRNEERAFAFWSYVAANALVPLVREAAERMAREELEHAKTLRRERRKAFFHDWHRRPVARERYDLAALELEVCRSLEEHAEMNERQSEYRELALEARMLSLDLASDPLQDPAPVGPPPPRSLDALCEWLADYYIEAGENLLTLSARERAQALASIAIKRLAIVRDLKRGFRQK